jgi:hypothetical protein
MEYSCKSEFEKKKVKKERLVILFDRPLFLTQKNATTFPSKCFSNIFFVNVEQFITWFSYTVLLAADLCSTSMKLVCLFYQGLGPIVRWS